MGIKAPRLILWEVPPSSILHLAFATASVSAIPLRAAGIKYVIESPILALAAEPHSLRLSQGGNQSLLVFIS